MIESELMVRGSWEGGPKYKIKLLHYEGASWTNGMGETDFRVYAKLPIEELTEEMKSVVYRKSQELWKELTALVTAELPESKKWKEEWLQEAKELFEKAKYPTIYFKEIPNEYCGPKCCPHKVWLLVTTPIGTIKIGWRKRVLNIDWRETVVKADGKTLFPDEDTTRGDGSDGQMIHAWGYEKAAEYLFKLLETGMKVPQNS